MPRKLLEQLSDSLVSAYEEHPTKRVLPLRLCPNDGRREEDGASHQEQLGRAQVETGQPEVEERDRCETAQRPDSGDDAGPEREHGQPRPAEAAPKSHEPDRSSNRDRE